MIIKIDLVEQLIQQYVYIEKQILYNFRKNNNIVKILITSTIIYCWTKGLLRDTEVWQVFIKQWKTPAKERLNYKLTNLKQENCRLIY